MFSGRGIQLNKLSELGWDDALQAEYQDETRDGRSSTAVPARIAAEHRGEYVVIDADGRAIRAVLTGRMRASPEGAPAVGDWVDVEVDPSGVSRVVARYRRRSVFVRKAAGDQTVPQVVAANLDVVFVVTWPGADFNPRRIERYLTTIREGGAEPVIVLTKMDLCEDPAPFIAELQQVAPDVPIELVCALDGRGLEAIWSHLGPRRTGALVGSSGAGKSTLLNALLGRSAQATGGLRTGPEKGRHVTRHRELFVDPKGLIIDTPGMRELGLWADREAAGSTYDEVVALASHCRFRDCSHDGEPGCAVAQAIAEGALDPARLEAYRKQTRELEHLASQRGRHAKRERRLEAKRRGREYKSIQRASRRWKGED